MTLADPCCPQRRGTLQCSESWGRTAAASCGHSYGFDGKVLRELVAQIVALEPVRTADWSLILADLLLDWEAASTLAELSVPSVLTERSRFQQV